MLLEDLAGSQRGVPHIVKVKNCCENKLNWNRLHWLVKRNTNILWVLWKMELGFLN